MTEENVTQNKILSFIYSQMKKLDNKEITAEEAKAQALLASEAIKCITIYQ